MAIGGALRAALKAGDFVQAAMQSRRAARALSNLNASGGVSGRGLDAPDFLGSRGFDVGSMTAPGTGNPYMDWVQPSTETRYFNAFADSPFGGSVYSTSPGRGASGPGRMKLSGSGENYNLPGDILKNRIGTGLPIEAPYEGMRVMRGPVDMRYGESSTRPGAWQGRGRGTPWMESPIEGGFTGWDEPWSSGSVWNSPIPMGSTGPSSYASSFPWRMFAENSAWNAPMTPLSTGRRIGFDDIMGAQGSLIRRADQIPFSQWDIPF